MIKKVLLYFIIIFSAHSLEAFNIVFDMGDVLVATNKFNVFMAMGPFNLLKYIFFDKQNPKYLQKKIFDVLDFLGKQKEHHGLMAIYQGRPLPKIMCDWLMGIKDYEAVMQEVYDQIDILYDQGFFVNEREVEIIEAALDAMFNPTTFANNVYIKSHGLKLARKLAQKGHTLYIVSNWDADSFNKLLALEHMQPLFELFDHENIVISGAVHAMKPHATIFDYFIQRYNLNPAETYFIDDSVENCIAADRTGITSVQLIDGDYKAIKKFFKNQGIL